MDKRKLCILVGAAVAALIVAVLVIVICAGGNGDVPVDVITTPSDTTAAMIPSSTEKTETEQESSCPTEFPTEDATQPQTQAPTVGATTATQPSVPDQTETQPVQSEAPTQPEETTPATKPTQAPPQAPTEGPAEKPTQAPTVEPTEEPTQPTTQAPVTPPTQAPAEKPTQSPTTEPTQESEDETVKETYAIIPLQYPETAVKTLKNRMISLSAFCARAAGESNYIGNRHYTGTNVVISPYYTGAVDGITLPVYATPVYVADGNCGVLHSYASVDVDFGSHESISFTLEVDSSVNVSSVQVYAHDKAEAICQNRTITLTVSKHGMYTVVLNDDQQHAITLMVRRYRDEEAEIAAYIAEYGEKNVIVYEPGIHEISYQLLSKSNMVLYLKAGAILLPKHTMDITSDDDAANKAEMGAKESNGIGLNRYAVVTAHNRRNVTIAGRGTVDMTQLDWHERRGIVFTMCSNVTMDGVILVNPCEWSFITYRCSNVTVTQSAVLGYRTNSDAFAICNSTNVTVSDCFARTGDDMFEVKTLGGEDTAVSKNITFDRCQAWGSKARCFGVIGEIEKDISDITFQNGIVIFRDAIWDNNRIGSLIVLRECGSGEVDGITFRNMMIHHDKGRAINVGVYSHTLTDSKMTGILFENIVYDADMNSQLRLNAGAGNVLEVKLKNVTANGELLTRANMIDHFYWDAEGLYTLA